MSVSRLEVQNEPKEESEGMGCSSLQAKKANADVQETGETEETEDSRLNFLANRVIRIFINPDNLIKSRIAETIVEEMLRRAGYQVYSLGYESVLHNLMQTREKPERENEVSLSVANMPAFLVVKNNIPDFIEVKYRKDGKLGRKEIESWSKGRVLLVYPFAPYFSVSRIDEFRKTGKLYSLEKDRYVPIKKEVIDMFSPFVEKYLKGK